MKTIDLNTRKHAEDIVVTYHTRDEMARQYRQAIWALDLDDEQFARLADFDRLETNRSLLEKQLNKTKLWHYAPEQRETVKEARRFLQQMLDAKIPYGKTVRVPHEEIESFLQDAMKQLGVAQYAYVQEKSTLNALESTKEVIGHMRHFVEDVIEKIPNPVEEHLRLSA
jgi:hypothetical protein